MVLAYSIAVFAYTHSNFVTKDMFKIVQTQLQRIENKIDMCNDNRIKDLKYNNFKR